jgi:hypothetical protein
MTLYKVRNGHRSDDVCELVKDTTYVMQNVVYPMVILKFDDGETFGYATCDVRKVTRKP